MTDTKVTGMEYEARLFFYNRLRQARANALRDAEGYHDIIVVLEQLGLFQSQGAGTPGSGLDSYTESLKKIAEGSILAIEIPSEYPSLHPAFDKLYKSVRLARNDAVHEGAYARHLTNHAVQLALILEDALMTGLTSIADYMVRDPVCAAAWQPVSFVRQQMLLNSFSYLPVQLEKDGVVSWYTIADSSVARYLREASSRTDRRRRLARTVANAYAEGLLKLDPAITVAISAEIADVLAKFDGRPLLILDEHQRLAGIVTAFDLL